jgi:phosphate transport system permease protein
MSALRGLEGSPARRRREALIRGGFLFAAGISVIISAAIILSLAGEALSFATQVDLSQLFTDGWFPRRDQFDIGTIVSGTLIVAGIGMVVATPLGIGAAIYLAEYASPRTRRILKPILEVLAGIPSVVLGFFALTVISPTLIDPICPGATPLFNLAAAGIGVGILITPLIASIAEDAMHAVPNSLREASYGLGARKRATSMFVVVPAAVSGIVASLIIGLSRGIGETMVVAIAAGQQPRLTADPRVPVETMTAYIVQVSMGDTPTGTIEYRTIFVVGTCLFVMTFVMNVLSYRLARRFRRDT